MTEPMRLTEDTLFLACTRPAMIAGVTMEAMALNVMFSCILFLVAGSILYGLVAIPIHALCESSAGTIPTCSGFCWLGSRPGAARATRRFGADRPARR